MSETEEKTSTSDTENKHGSSDSGKKIIKATATELGNDLKSETVDKANSTFKVFADTFKYKGNIKHEYLTGSKISLVFGNKLTIGAGLTEELYLAGRDKTNFGSYIEQKVGSIYTYAGPYNYEQKAKSIEIAGNKKSAFANFISMGTAAFYYGKKHNSVIAKKNEKIENENKVIQQRNTVVDKAFDSVEQLTTAVAILNSQVDTQMETIHDLCENITHHQSSTNEKIEEIKENYVQTGKTYLCTMKQVKYL